MGDRRDREWALLRTAHAIPKEGAIEYANKVSKKIILIDGEELTRLMVQYGVGVRIERTVDIKRMDADYFDDSED